MLLVESLAGAGLQAPGRLTEHRVEALLEREEHREGLERGLGLGPQSPHLSNGGRDVLFHRLTEDGRDSWQRPEDTRC